MQGDARLPSDGELEQRGAVVGEICIDAQDIFDTGDPREDRSLYRLANRLHVTTRESVIRQQLLFDSGDRYSGRLLAESERILRSSRYLYDASVRPIAYKDGRVDVMVTTRDVWTLNPGISFGRKGGANTFGVELEELNILGSGTSLSLSRKSGIDRDSTLFEYKDSHLFGTWTTLNASYANNSDGSKRGLAIERPFYALDTRRAGGVTLLDDKREESLYDLGEVVEEFAARQKYAEVYGGWSTGLRGDLTRRWRVGATYDDNQFAPTLDTTSAALVPRDRRLVYPWVDFELIQDDFRTLSNRDQIGRTEDFELGTRWRARLGWSDTSFGADRDALIFKTTLTQGIAMTPNDTLLLSGGWSGRVEKSELRDSVVDAAIRYYVKQSSRRLFFTTLQAWAGHALDLDDPLLLGGDNGLRGYPLRYQGGTRRALLTIEQRYFTDWYPFRLLRVGGAAFFDVGRIWGETPYNTPSLGLLRDVGIGLRIGNTRSGLGNVIHVDLAMPLDGDSSIDSVQFSVSTLERF
jgi:outer membrane protein assembly factor BamA